MTQEKKYEVWGVLGRGEGPEFTSDDPVEIVRWLRKFPPEERFYMVHPTGRMFHAGKMSASEFISWNGKAAADDIVRRAFKAGNPEGVAQEILDLYFGR
jgi:hypothetical protein